MAIWFIRKKFHSLAETINEGLWDANTWALSAVRPTKSFADLTSNQVDSENKADNERCFAWNIRVDMTKSVNFYRQGFSKKRRDLLNIPRSH